MPNNRIIEFREGVQLTGLLEMIAAVKHKNCMLEIGSYAGDSTILFARNFKQVFAVDPWQNGYDDTDIASYRVPMEDVYFKFSRRIKGYCNIVPMRMTSEQANEILKISVFDLVYIDGNHQYEHVLKDIQMWMPKCYQLGGHDINLPGVNKAVHDMFGDNFIVFPDTSWLVTI